MFRRHNGNGPMWYPSCGGDARLIHHPIFNSQYIRPSFYIFNDVSAITSLYNSKIEFEVIKEYDNGQVQGIDASVHLIEFTFKRNKYIQRRNVIFINSDNESVAEWLMKEEIEISYIHNYHMDIRYQPFNYIESSLAFNKIIKKLKIRYLSIDVDWQCFSEEVKQEIQRYRLIGVYSYENVSKYKNKKMNEGFFQLYDLNEYI